MKKRIADVKIGDKIYGTDGKWHKVISKTDIKLSYHMYELTFDNDTSVKCANTHLWNIYVNGKMYPIDAEGLYQQFDFYKGCPIGTPDGHKFIEIKKVKPELVQCIETDAPDHQFAIYGLSK